MTDVRTLLFTWLFSTANQTSCIPCEQSKHTNVLGISLHFIYNISEHIEMT